MRHLVSWMIGDDQIFGTWDSPTQTTSQTNKALLITSGGNEIRSGTHGGQSQIAQFMAANGYHVLRYDRRGIGDSSGLNNGFEDSRDDLLCAVQFIRQHLGMDTAITAFGNCDAATAILLNHKIMGINEMILANPWTIDKLAYIDLNMGSMPNPPTQPSAAAIRARYWARIKNPRSIIDLFTGKINMKKLISGLHKASKQEDLGALAISIAQILSTVPIPTKILIANKDTTAMAFMAAYKSSNYDRARSNDNIQINSLNSASHSFSDEVSRAWLFENLLNNR